MNVVQKERLCRCESRANSPRCSVLGSAEISETFGFERTALYEELRSKRFWAALDVFYAEPLPVNDPIRSFENVLLSPHMGYVTDEVYETFFNQVTDNVLAWKLGAAYRDALKI